MVASHAEKHLPERKCIATGQVFEKEDLIRFVLDNEGGVVPDVAEKLPGRGMWVSCSKDALSTAIKKNSFASSAKQPVTIREDIEELIAELLYQRMLHSLSLNRRGGNVVSGFEKVRDQIKKGNAVALLHASDAAEDGQRKLQSKENILVCDAINREDLSRVMGGENVVHVAVLGGEGAKDFMLQCRRFTGFHKGSSL